ncbi:MAG TPA: hypothetical protein VFR35_08435 [Actinoplanes sp.]|nr:hypothetical protein [Actinoplanes sp.]
MTTQTDAVTEVTASPPPPAGPRVTLQVLRLVAVLHSLAFLAQPVFAGGYLMGDLDALAWHIVNAFVVTGLDVLQLVCAIVYFWKGRGPAWPIWASLAVALAAEVQVGMGFERILVVHLPLGVALVVGQILITVWLYRAAAAKARTPRPARDRRTAREDRPTQGRRIRRERAR